MKGRAEEWFAKFPGAGDPEPQAVDMLTEILHKKISGLKGHGPKLVHNLVYSVHGANDFCPKGMCGWLTF